MKVLKTTRTSEKRMVKQQKRGINVFWIIAIVLLVIAGLIAFAKISGFAIEVASRSSSPSVFSNFANDIKGIVTKNSVTRDIVFDGDKFKVTLHIVSNENILAVTENLASDIQSFEVSKNYEISEFKQSENTWLLADKNVKINSDLIYYLPSDYSKSLSGNFSILSTKDQLVTTAIKGKSVLCNNVACVVGISRAKFNFYFLPTKRTDADSLYNTAIVYKKGEKITNGLVCLKTSKTCKKVSICRTSQCSGSEIPVSFAVPSGWKGDYILRVRDKKTNNLIEVPFKI